MPAPRPIAPGLFACDGDVVRLVCARCETCRELHFPASDTCPYCGGRAVSEQVGPRGTLRLFTTVTNPPPGYRGRVPYGFGVVELDGSGLCVVTRLGESDGARLRPGLPMRLAVETLGGGEEGDPVSVWTFLPEPA